MNICEYGCKREAKYVLKNGKYCCETHSTKCIAIRNKNSNKLKQLFSDGVLIAPIYRGCKPWNTGLSKKTDKRVLDHSINLHQRYKAKELIPSGLGRKHTEEEKTNLSIKRIKYLKLHPEQVPYRLNHSSRISYPERYFKLLFLTEKIPLLYHKQIGLYELDFYNEAKKKYIEIDGESHYVDKKTIEIDKRRTVFLSENGWRGKRIRWSTYKRASKNDKKQIIQEIRSFLE